MREEKKNACPAGATTEQANANETTAILANYPSAVKMLMRCREHREGTGMQAKDAALIIREIFPKFNRQLLSQCENWKEYGILIHPAGLQHLLSPGSFLTPPPAHEPVAPSGLTQCERILRHFRDFGSITSLEAMKDYGIMRLASRISDLKKQGYIITTDTETGKNRYGEATSYARYYLEEEPQNADP